MKSSARDRAKAEREAVAGDVTGSMWKRERKRRGPLVERKVGRALVRKVMGTSVGGQSREGRARSEGRSARGAEVIGVRIKLSRC